MKVRLTQVSSQRIEKGVNNNSTDLDVRMLSIRSSDSLVERLVFMFTSLSRAPEAKLSAPHLFDLLRDRRNSIHSIFHVDQAIASNRRGRIWVRSLYQHFFISTNLQAFLDCNKKQNTVTVSGKEVYNVKPYAPDTQR